ncbi:hypothetical protein PanWU01x14_257340 [Parasponia andersonii]|uniref:Uncharacterized protein n=1 Tax=Parasponia andersonii TaxID=3476 RepID=A0A2P5BA04_PARAD|nr:hypothetical protein PanWU01x14_257340 [Parasponia andersonii]
MQYICNLYDTFLMLVVPAFSLKVSTLFVTEPVCLELLPKFFYSSTFLRCSGIGIELPMLSADVVICSDQPLPAFGYLQIPHFFSSLNTNVHCRDVIYINICIKELKITNGSILFYVINSFILKSLTITICIDTHNVK